MSRNMGTIDRVVRTTLVLVVAVLYFTNNLTGLAAIVLGVFAVIFLVTSLIGFCPLYTALGIRTDKSR